MMPAIGASVAACHGKVAMRTFVKPTACTLLLALEMARYKFGVDPYLNVITAQTILLSNQRTALTLCMEQMTATVQLIEALGGGWDASRLASRSPGQQ